MEKKHGQALIALFLSFWCLDAKGGEEALVSRF
jgi:hypothetical protein